MSQNQCIGMSVPEALQLYWSQLGRQELRRRIARAWGEPEMVSPIVTLTSLILREVVLFTLIGVWCSYRSRKYFPES